ncbi:cysteine--tRNA ligase [Humisphaera borealis]|uniref:Cysteine--tRNA ligase n=1 Tax=Humisphaera borealis TaxID=2807512 RepID=A0A7M2WXT4_9BACT|nr:cysteine--tRNA ligase [Humisphaera borealis]QOV89611.1 cysteine--tRNA ligase [Humisphaera borealis]
MTLRVYNTLSQQKELFQTVRPGKVGMYLCGPTVYKSPHVGHMVGPVIFDAIKRYLQFKGYEVTWVVNITDVDDKLIDAAERLGTTVKDLADKHTAEYFECLAALGVNSIDHFPRATGHIVEIVELCQTLINKGFAYAADGNVWFDVTKDEDYGKLSHQTAEEQEAGGEGATAGKKSGRDFALWKAAKPGEISWDSPWGKGRPGWHIECSAMAMKILGPTFDMHGGGMDLKFPHHENEVAQSESATGQPFAKYWLHNGLTKFNTKKISGSDMFGSEEAAKALAAVSAKKLVGEHGALVLRYLLLSSHYRRPIDFTETAISDTKKAMATFTRLFERIDRLVPKPATPPATPAPGSHGHGASADDMDRVSANLLDGEHAAFAKAVLGLKMKFLEMMDDDFNTAGAIAALHEMAGEVNAFLEQNEAEKTKPADVLAAAAAGVQTLRNLGGVLGLFQEPAAGVAAKAADDGLTGKLMELFIQLRANARQTKNFALADDIRKGLTAIGVTLEDGADGTRWRKD